PTHPRNRDIPSTPLVPSYPAPVSVPPTTRPATRQALLLTGTIVGLLLLLILGMDITVYSLAHRATTPPTVAGILSRANAAKWRDTTFAINDEQTATIGDATSGGITASTTTVGQGAIIRAPFRAHLTLSYGAVSTSATEVIIDGDTYYLKLPPSLVGPDQKSWLKLSGVGDASGLGTSLGSDLAH